MKKRIIKITERQLKETEGKAFEYLNIDNDTTPHNGNSEISVSGKLNDIENGKPITTDKVASTIIPQSYNRFHHYANQFHNTMRENVDNDKNDDGIDDFYNNDDMNVFNNGIDDDNLTRLPQNVINKTELLIQAITNSHLTPKQQAIVLNKIICNMNTNDLPNMWLKELMMKLHTDNKTN